MFSELRFQRQFPYFGQRKAEILCQMGQCSEEEQILMKFLYGTMPLRDVGVYDFSVFYGFARHALMLREQVAWCQELSEELFLHDVLYYRINTEQISDCRSFFYDCLKDRINGLSVEQAVLGALKYCHAHGITVICDLNYRAKMWSREKAQSVMKELMQYVDLCIANDEDFEAALGIHAFDGDMAHGIDQIETYRQGMKQIQELYPNCKAVASVLRNLKTAEDGEWMGIYLKDGHFYESPIHTVHSLEAVGAGDAFAGALIHSLVHQFSPQKLIDFSITASVMKLMIQHDFNLVSEEEILRIMKTGETNVIR